MFPAVGPRVAVRHLALRGGDAYHADHRPEGGAVTAEAQGSALAPEDCRLHLRNPIAENSLAGDRDHDRSIGEGYLEYIDPQKVAGLGALDVDGTRGRVHAAPVQLVYEVGLALELALETVVGLEDEFLALGYPGDALQLRAECKENIVP